MKIQLSALIYYKADLTIISLKTRYDYNLTIMKSPKSATDNGLKNKLKATFEIEQC